MKCRKHFWKNILVHHEFEMDTKPYSNNEVFGFTTIPAKPCLTQPTLKELERNINPAVVDSGFRIEICCRCRKVRSPK